MSRVLIQLASAVVVAALLAALAPAAVVAATDAPDTCSDATTASPVNTWIENPIQSATDQDWFRLTVSSTRWYQVVVGALPKNYRLDLYSACGTAAKYSSNRPGVQSEEVYRSLAAGTWFAKVSSASGAYSTTTNYKLKFRPLPNRLFTLSSRAWVDTDGYLSIVGEILNNTPVTIEHMNVYAMLIDSGDEVVGVHAVGAHLDYLLPRARTAFNMYFKKPSGYHHYELVFAGASTTDKPVAGLKITAGTPYQQYGTWYTPGTVKNAGSEVSDFTFVSCVLYDTLGAVVNTDWTYASPSTLAPGASGSFKCWFTDHWSGVNRTVFYVEGT